MSINNPIDRDGPGRREDDRHRCALHDFIEERNITCFDFIKGNVKKLEDRVAQHVDEANKTMITHKQLQERTFRDYVTKWVFVIVIGIATTAFGVIMGLVSTQVADTHSDVKIIAENIHQISNDMMRFKTIQETVLDDQQRFQHFIDRKQK